jgi:hypothetical protein
VVVCRAGDELGLGNTGAGTLEDVVGDLGGASGVGFGFDANDVAKSIAEERTGEDGGVEEA